MLYLTEAGSVTMAQKSCFAMRDACYCLYHTLVPLVFCLSYLFLLEITILCFYYYVSIIPHSSMNQHEPIRVCKPSLIGYYHMFTIPWFSIFIACFTLLSQLQCFVIFQQYLKAIIITEIQAYCKKNNRFL